MPLRHTMFLIAHFHVTKVESSRSCAAWCWTCQSFFARTPLPRRLSECGMVVHGVCVLRMGVARDVMHIRPRVEDEASLAGMD